MNGQSNVFLTFFLKIAFRWSVALKWLGVTSAPHSPKKHRTAFILNGLERAWGTLFTEASAESEAALAEVCVYTVLRTARGGQISKVVLIKRAQVESKNGLVDGPKAYSFAF